MSNAIYKQDLHDIALAVANGSKAYTDNKIDELKWELGTYDLSIESDTTTTYQKTIPSGAIDCMINKIGGMSYKSNNLFVKSTCIDGKQLNDNNNISTNPSWCYSNYISVKANTQYVSNASGFSFYICYYDKDKTYISGQTGIGFTTPNDTAYVRISCTIVRKDILMLNEGSSVLPYEEGFDGIRDSAITSVVSKDSNNTTLDTYAIDNNIQALDGYGWGINDTCYNYIDFENKKFIQKVGRVKANSLEWARLPATGYFWATLNDGKIYSTGTPNLLNNNYSTVAGMYGNSSGMNDKSITMWLTLNSLLINDTSYSDATTFTNHFTDDDYIYFKLATPVETDISQYITTNKVIVEASGTLTFTNTYNQAVPSDVNYLKEVAK